MKKLSISLLVLIVCATFALGWVIDQFFDSYSDDTDKDVIAHYQTLGQQLADSADALNDSEAFVASWNLQGSNPITIIAEQKFPLPAELQPDFVAGKPLVLSNGNALTFHYYLTKKASVLTFSPDELAVNSKASQLNLILTAIFYLGIVAIVAIWLFPLVSRLNQLSKTAILFGSGQLNQRVPESRSSYINQLECEFNRMAEKIENLIADNKLISSAVSHDLKTPLARLRLGLDIIADNNDPQVQQKYVDRLSKDIDEMQTLINVLIDYARLEQSLIKLARNPIRLDDIFTQLKLEYSTSQLNFDLVDHSQGLTIIGDENYLNMLFHNLLDNAFRYCNQQVTVKLNKQSEQVVVGIHDDGAGIDMSKRKDILKPFIKSNSQGHGLGLAIAERIAHWHQAEINVGDSELLSGAMFEVKFSLTAKI
jgi:signal transduction histidine kinase